MTARITLYGRPGCHLCDEAEARIVSLAGEDAAIEKINIELDDELHKRFFEKIPVIEVDGVQIAELGQYRRPAFAQALADALSG